MKGIPHHIVSQLRDSNRGKANAIIITRKYINTPSSPLNLLPVEPTTHQPFPSQSSNASRRNNEKSTFYDGKNCLPSVAFPRKLILMSRGVFVGESLN